MRTVTRSIVASLLVALWLAFAFNYRVIGKEGYDPAIGFAGLFLFFAAACLVILPLLLLLVKLVLSKIGNANSEFAVGWWGTAIMLIYTMWTEFYFGPMSPSVFDNMISAAVSFLLLASAWVAYALLMSRGFKRERWGW